MPHLEKQTGPKPLTFKLSKVLQPLKTATTKNLPSQHFAEIPPALEIICEGWVAQHCRSLLTLNKDPDLPQEEKSQMHFRPRKQFSPVQPHPTPHAHKLPIPIRPTQTHSPSPQT